MSEKSGRTEIQRAALQVIEGRRSVRSFDPERVPQNDIEAMLTAAVSAPSASNFTNWHFVVVTTTDTIHELADAVVDAYEEAKKWPDVRDDDGLSRHLAAVARGSSFFREAPVVVLAYETGHESTMRDILVKRGLPLHEIYSLWPQPDLQGVAAAVENLLLAAHALGYGACWMTGPILARERLNRIVGRPDDTRLVALVPVGVPRNTKPSRHREASAFVTWIT